MQTKNFLIATVAGLALAGCAANSLGTQNTSMYSIHQPVVERTNYVMDLTGDSAGIAATERSRLDEWFEGLRLSYGDRVSIDYGSAYPDKVTTDAVASVAAEYGVLVEGTAPVTSGDVASGVVRVIVTRSKASVPSCPDWSVDHDRNYNASNHSNYGCSTNSNLAAMIADPEDLVRGREAQKLDANSGKKAVDTYRAKTGGN